MFNEEEDTLKYEEIFKKGMKEHDDMSEYSKESGMYDERIFYKIKKVIGKFKDESTDEVIEKQILMK